MKRLEPQKIFLGVLSGHRGLEWVFWMCIAGLWAEMDCITDVDKRQHLFNSEESRSFHRTMLKVHLSFSIFLDKSQISSTIENENKLLESHKEATRKQGLLIMEESPVSITH